MVVYAVAKSELPVEGTFLYSAPVKAKESAFEQKKVRSFFFRLTRLVTNPAFGH